MASDTSFRGREDHCRRPFQLSMMIEKLAYKRLPKRNGVGGPDQKMAFIAKWRKHPIFGQSSGTRVGIVHAFGECRTKEGVVLGVDP